MKSATGATLSAEESIQIDEFQLDTCKDSTMEVDTSSLRDVVIRVPSTTKGSGKDSGGGSTSALNVSGILTLSHDEVNGSGSPAILYLPERSSSTSSRGTTFPAEESMASLKPKASSQEAQAPSSPEVQGKKMKSCCFKRRRKSYAVAPTTKDTEEGPQPKMAFEHLHVASRESDINCFFTKSEHLDDSGNEVFLLKTEKVPMLAKLFQGSKSKALINDLCLKVEEYIKNNLFTDKFTVIIYGGDDGAKLCSFNLAKKFYNLLKNCLSKRLNHCIILRAKFSLKAVFKLSRPFIPNDVKQKISLVNDVRELVVFHGIPDTILLNA